MRPERVCQHFRHKRTNTLQRRSVEWLSFTECTEPPHYPQTDFSHLANQMTLTEYHYAFTFQLNSTCITNLTSGPTVHVLHMPRKCDTFRVYQVDCVHATSDTDASLAFFLPTVSSMKQEPCWFGFLTCKPRSYISSEHLMKQINIRNEVQSWQKSLCLVIA